MRISSAESEVMEVLWRRSPLAAEEIAAEIATANGWTEATVKTLINRLKTKRAITADKDGRRFLYRPLLARAAWLADQSHGLVDRLFDGRLAPLVSHFSETRQLSAEDIAELKRIVGELDDQ